MNNADADQTVIKWQTVQALTRLCLKQSDLVIQYLLQYVGLCRDIKAECRLVYTVGDINCE